MFCYVFSSYKRLTACSAPYNMQAFDWIRYLPCPDHLHVEGGTSEGRAARELDKNGTYAQPGGPTSAAC